MRIFLPLSCLLSPHTSGQQVGTLKTNLFPFFWESRTRFNTPSPLPSPFRPFDGPFKKPPSIYLYQTYYHLFIIPFFQNRCWNYYHLFFLLSTLFDYFISLQEVIKIIIISFIIHSFQLFFFFKKINTEIVIISFFLLSTLFDFSCQNHKGVLKFFFTVEVPAQLAC